MRNLQVILRELVTLSVWVGLLLAGWQTALAADSMQQHLVSVVTWVHFALYALGGFILLALAMMVPVAIVAGIRGVIAKSWPPASIRRFLLAGLLGTLLVVFVGLLKIKLVGPLILGGNISLRNALIIALMLVFVYVLGYMVAIGALQLLESRPDRSRWSLLWGWWLFMVIVPPLVVVGQPFWGGLTTLGMALPAIIVTAVLILLFRLVPRIYDGLQRWGTRRRWAVAAVAPILFLATWPLPGAARSGEPATEDHPPVVFITIDALRPDALGCYPEGTCLRLGTPNMDRLAAEGTAFERAYATAPWTRPSVPSYLSGLPPSAHGAHSDESSHLAQGATTLAEILQGAGYATCGLPVNSVVREGSGNEQGFDVYLEEVTYQQDSRRLLFQGLIDRVRLSWPEPMTPNPNPYMERDAVRRAKRFIEEHSGERFFLWIHLSAPHHIYYPPAQYRKQAEEKWGIKVRFADVLRQRGMTSGFPTATRERVDGLLALYAGEVAFSDDGVGDVMKTLEELDILDNCLVILSSDHGEEFYEHDRFTHSRSLYPEVLHVPLIVRLPGRVPGGKRVEDPVSLVDIPPTVLDLVGVEASLGGVPAEFTGGSLVPLLNGETVMPRPVFFESPLLFDQELKGVLYNNLFYIGGSTAVLHPRLYNLQDDPDAHFNILRDRPEEAGMLAALLDEYDARCAEIAERIGVGRSPADIEQLRALGYIN